VWLPKWRFRQGLMLNGTFFVFNISERAETKTNKEDEICVMKLNERQPAFIFGLTVARRGHEAVNMAVVPMVGAAVWTATADATAHAVVSNGATFPGPNGSTNSNGTSSNWKPNAREFGNG